MSIWQYILKSVMHYWKQQLAILSGIMLGTAILTGALIVGDSVQYSLKSLVSARLGNIQSILPGRDRFVGIHVADQLSKELNTHMASVLMNRGLMVHPETNQRLPKTQILGVTDDFWKFGDTPYYSLKSNEVVVSESVADKLKLSMGDVIILRIAKEGMIPLNAPFVSHEEVSLSMRLIIAGIADDQHMGRFSLQSNQARPYTAFVSQEALAKKLEMTGKANLLLAESSDVDALNQALARHMLLSDYGLILDSIDDKGHYMLGSERVFIDDELIKQMKSLELQSKGIMTYLVNSIETADKETPYSFVSGIDQELTDILLGANDILVNQWLAEDLDLNEGDSLVLKYYVIGPLRRLEEKQHHFIIKQIVSDSTDLFNRKLMPAFPGLADAGSCSDWEAGIPIDLDKIRDKDEDYWDVYGGTPKAYVSLTTAHELWDTPFGNYTALRIETDQPLEQLSKDLLFPLSPENINLSFIQLRNQSMKAATNGVNFGELFLSLSFFIIAAALLLTILLQSLNLRTRANEGALLSALGFSFKQVLKIRILESILTALPAVLLGILLGIGYNYCLVFALNSVWTDAVQTNELQVFILPNTLLLGGLSGVVMALIPIYWVSRKQLKKTIKQQIIKVSSSTERAGAPNGLLVLSILCFLLAISFMTYAFSKGIDQNSGLFLGAGALVIGAIMMGFLWNARKTSISFSVMTSMNQLAQINLRRNASRSLTVMVLLALGTYTTVITSANRKTFHGTESQNASGTGGYNFWAELALPLLFDLNTKDGLEELGLQNEEGVENTHFLQFHLLEGDDASCLNLNQVQHPKILGVSAHTLDERQSFSFAKTLDMVEKEHPWLALEMDMGEDVIPAFADQTVITWGLIKQLGDSLYYTNEAGKIVTIVLVGGLEASVFQGHLLIADHQFSKHFPSVAGSRVMMVDADASKTAQIGEWLQDDLVDYGLSLHTTEERLANFNSVTNTYLTVFMILGGLGVIIGTIGLGIVLIRNLLERKAEIALLKAIGFSKNSIFQLLFLENLYLLLFGMISGIIAAAIGILPSLLSASFNFGSNGFYWLIGIIFLSGLIWIYWPLQSFLRNDILTDLRSE